VKFIDANTGFVATPGGQIDPTFIYKTGDGTTTWAQKYSSYRDVTGLTRIICPTPSICYCSLYLDAVQEKDTSDYFIKTTDGGETWTNLNVPTSWGFWDIHFIDAVTGYGVSDGNIYKTTDGAKTWSKQQVLPENIYSPKFNSIRFISKDTGYAAGYYSEHAGPFSGFLCKTVNAGECWQLVTNLPEYPTVIEFPNGNTGYVGGQRTGVFGIGTIMKTQAGPWARFTVADTLVCLGDSLFVTNNSTGYTAYKWYVNGKLQSTTSSPYLHFSSTGTQLIKMMATNGSVTDSAKYTIRIADIAYVSVLVSPLPKTICIGNSATFNALASMQTQLNYQWQTDNGNGNGFTDINDPSIYSSANTNELFSDPRDTSISGVMIRCEITAQCAVTGYTDAVALTVLAGPTITSQPANDTVCAGKTGLLTTKASGSNPSYQWTDQYGNYLTEGTSYSGVTTPRLQFNNVSSSLNQTFYICKISNTCASVSTKQAQLSVSSYSYTATAGPDQTVCSGSRVNLQGSITNSGFGTWHTDGTGTFYPYSSSLSLQYFPGTQDLNNGIVHLSLVPIASACGSVASQVTIHLSTCTGTDEKQLSEAITVYPIPTIGGMLYVRSELAMTHLILYSVTGVVTSDVTVSGLTDYTLDISGLAKGAYYLSIGTQEGDRYTKMVLKD
jgi:hypothetical protein